MFEQNHVFTTWTVYRLTRHGKSVQNRKAVPAARRQTGANLFERSPAKRCSKRQPRPVFPGAPGTGSISQGRRPRRRDVRQPDPNTGGGKGRVQPPAVRSGSWHPVATATPIPGDVATWVIPPRCIARTAHRPRAPHQTCGAFTRTRPRTRRRPPDYPAVASAASPLGESRSIAGAAPRPHLRPDRCDSYDFK